ncbi:unnamed protein product [Malus baccata var. baccata]
MVAQGVQLATKEEESYRGRVKNLLHASHMLSLAHFRESCFGHLDSVDRLTFSGQLVHELSLHRVSNQGVKDLEGLTYLIGCEVTWFTKDFCLITGLHCDEPYDMEVEPSNIRLLTKYFPHRFGFVGERKRFRSLFTELEKAFQECKNEDSAFKLKLLYFVKGVLIGVKMWAYKIIPQLDKSLRYCKMTDPAAYLRILQWATTKKQPVHERLQIYIIESQKV